jgi:hypothetical protein
MAALRAVIQGNMRTPSVILDGRVKPGHGEEGHLG